MCIYHRTPQLLAELLQHGQGEAAIAALGTLPTMEAVWCTAEIIRNLKAFGGDPLAFSRALECHIVQHFPNSEFIGKAERANAVHISADDTAIPDGVD